MCALAELGAGADHRPMPSRWCAWCGELAPAPIIVGGVVVYHALCWERRATLVERAKLN